jgi:hypothetical protein
MSHRSTSQHIKLFSPEFLIQMPNACYIFPFGWTTGIQEVNSCLKESFTSPNSYLTSDIIIHPIPQTWGCVSTSLLSWQIHLAFSSEGLIAQSVQELKIYLFNKSLKKCPLFSVPVPMPWSGFHVFSHLCDGNLLSIGHLISIFTSSNSQIILFRLLV